MDLGTKGCLYCGQGLAIRTTRDIERKKFCSYACRQRWYWNSKPWDMRPCVEASLSPDIAKKKACPGSKNGRWLEDRTTVKFRPRYEGRLWKEAVFSRDDYTCQMCFQRGGKLQADHIIPYCLCTEEQKWDLNNGRTLCENCHRKTPTYGWRGLALKKRHEKNNAVCQ
jgi:5-methylcytosine-specific restriction endonuclease McrA